MTDVLIIGCGYVGRRAAARWIAEGRRVAALTRGNADELAALGIESIVGDILDPQLPKLPQAATVLHAVGLDRSSGRSMREVYVDGLANVLYHLPRPGRFLFVSSTSVYGQTDGEWVSEDSPAAPREGSGQVVLDAERVLRSKLPEAVVLRFAGIYGPGRLLKKAALLRGEALAGDCDKWLNLIHVDDGVEAILAAEKLARPGATFNIADGEPVTRREFYSYWAKLLGAPEARFEHQPEVNSSNRRITNCAARESLGWTPRYASYREGLIGL
jgi:nucleoside-diphosphate-sugar epimerase